MKRSLYTVALASLTLLASATAHADIIPNTGTLGPNDPFWSVAWHGLIPSGTAHGYLAQAPLVTNIPSPPWQRNVVGNNWIGVNANASIPGALGDGSHRYEYAFTTHILLANPEHVTGALGYDNFFIGGFVDGSIDINTGVYTRGQQFLTPTALLGSGNENKAGFCRDGDGFLPSSSYPNCTVNFGFDLPAGTYDITFVIQGDGGTDGFILNQRGVSLSVPEPGTLALLAFGLAGFGFRRRPTRRRPEHP